MNLVKWQSRAKDKVYGSDEIDSKGKITIEAQSKYIDQLLAQSQGAIWNTNTGVLNIDYSLPDLPAGMKWNIKVGFTNTEGRSGSWTTFGTSAVPIQNGHFIKTSTPGELSELQVLIEIANENGNYAAQVDIGYDANGNVTHSRYKGPSGSGEINPNWASQALEVVK